MSTSEQSLMDMAYDERSDLAAFLETLTPQEWNAPSLCDRWTVKDVVAHMVSYEELRAFGLNDDPLNPNAPAAAFDTFVGRRVTVE